jgi:peptide subunit release factor RF-3
LGDDLENALGEVELIKEAMPAFDREAFLAGRQSPGFLVQQSIILVCEKFLIPSLNSTITGRSQSFATRS